jgi:hypothetical protein
MRSFDHSGGGLKYGELATDPDPVVILSNAAVSERGIQPLDPSGTGRGLVRIGGVALPNRGPVSWRLSGFIIPGSNAWRAL